MSLHIETRGPVRAIGLRYSGKNQNQEVMKLWGELVPQCSKIETLEGGGCYGVCRCIPGCTDGSFEYIAAFAARPDAPVPEGMVAVDLPGGSYFTRRHEHVTDYMSVWTEAAGELAKDQEWVGFCNGPTDCQCATHPCFEFYPPEYEGDGPMVLHLPVQAK